MSAGEENLRSLGHSYYIYGLPGESIPCVSRTRYNGLGSRIPLWRASLTLWPKDGSLMKFLCKLVVSILPFPLVGLVFLKAPFGLVWSVGLSCLAFLAWWLLGSWLGIARPRLGSPLGLLFGVGIGAVLVVSSFAAIGVAKGYPVEFQPPAKFWLVQWPIQQLRPACLEETFMRAGTVHFLASFFGPGWGYLGGSLPLRNNAFLDRAIQLGTPLRHLLRRSSAFCRIS